MSHSTLTSNVHPQVRMSPFSGVWGNMASRLNPSFKRTRPTNLRARSISGPQNGMQANSVFCDDANAAGGYGNRVAGSSVECVLELNSPKFPLFEIPVPGTYPADSIPQSTAILKSGSIPQPLQIPHFNSPNFPHFEIPKTMSNTPENTRKIAGN